MKTKHKLITMAFLVIFTVAWNQTGLGISSAIKNIVSLPIDGIRSLGNWITGDNYKAINKKTAEAKKKAKAFCDLDKNKAIGDLEKVVCQCKAWAQCHKKLCSCDEMCPETFEIFERPKMSHVPDGNNCLAFENSPEFFIKHPMTQGYCWGHAVVTQRFNRLAFFNKKKTPMKEGKILTQKTTPKSWRDFYLGVIDKIIKNQATEIPGFSSLNEFSAHPTIQELLASRVSKEWANNAMTFEALNVAMSAKPMKPATALSLAENLKNRIDNHQSPLIVMTKRDARFNTHVVLVYGYKEEKGKTIFCLNDNNYRASENNQCQHKLVISSQGDIEGKGKVIIPSGEDLSSVKQVESLATYCRAGRGC